jgi:hypothetical protein
MIAPSNEITARSAAIGSTSRKPLPYAQAQMSIFTSSKGLVIKDLAVLPVMKNSVVFKHLVERQKVATQNIPSVHQAAVNLVL